MGPLDPSRCWILGSLDIFLRYGIWGSGDPSCGLGSQETTVSMPSVVFAIFNDQTANWLLFSGVLVAAFRSRLAKISRRPSARVPHGQGGMAPGPCPAAGTPTKASGSSHHSENRFSHPRSTLSEEGSRKRLPSISCDSGWQSSYLFVFPPLFSIFFPLNLSYSTIAFPRSIAPLSPRCHYLGSRLLLHIFGLNSLLLIVIAVVPFG